MKTFVTDTGIILTLVGSLYAVLASAATRWACRRSSYIMDERVPITVMKPLCGNEPGLYRQLRSFCAQNYGCFQLIFGVQDRDDPALRTVRRLQREFGTHDLCVVVDSAVHGTNRKIGNLINMLPHARHDHLVIADSDVIVPADYLARLAAALRDPHTGLVTCAYRGLPGRGLPAVLGAMFINEWFMPSVLLAARFGAGFFVSGATIGIRREVLERAGGLQMLADQLADDFQLGARVRSLGLHVVLSDMRVDTVVEEADAGALCRHLLRWLRTIRSVNPYGYALCFLTFSLPLAMLGVVLSGFAAAAIAWLGVAVLARVALPRPAAAAGTTGLARTLRLALLPIHDWLLAVLWCRGFLRREVTWRQQAYAVGRDGSLRHLG